MKRNFREERRQNHMVVESLEFLKSVYQYGHGTIAEEESFIRCLEEESGEKKTCHFCYM